MLQGAISMDIYSSRDITEFIKINFKPTRLYIKELSGVKYFGKTFLNDVEKYTGSGKIWRDRIKKYGKENIKTLWVSDWYYDPAELQEVALLFSKENKIVESKEWANMHPENGLNGGYAYLSDTFQQYIKTRDLANNPNYIEGIKNRDMSKVSQMRKGRCLATELNLKWYNNGVESIYVTEGTQPKNFIPGRIIKCGRPVSDASKIKASKSNGKPCISPSGEIFHSTKAAGNAYGITDVAIRGLIKRGKSGWRYK